MIDWQDIIDTTIAYRGRSVRYKDEATLRNEAMALVSRTGDSARWMLIDRLIEIFDKHEVGSCSPSR